MKSWNHAQLVKMAAREIRRLCVVMITELTVTGREEADILGWTSGGNTILAEVKTTRADFLSDKKKPWRRHASRGMGDLRYYVAPEGIIKPDDLPAGWGLFEVDGKGLRQAVGAIPLNSDKHAETKVLLSTLRRIGHESPTGVNIRCYSFKDSVGEPKATVGVRDG